MVWTADFHPPQKFSAPLKKGCLHIRTFQRPYRHNQEGKKKIRTEMRQRGKDVRREAAVLMGHHYNK